MVLEYIFLLGGSDFDSFSLLVILSCGLLGFFVFSLFLNTILVFLVFWSFSHVLLYWNLHHLISSRLLFCDLLLWSFGLLRFNGVLSYRLLVSHLVF